MLKRIVAWFRSLFAKNDSPSQSSQTSPAPVPVSIINPFPEVDRAIAHLRQFGRITDFELVQRMGRGLSEAEQAYAVSQGVVWREAPKPTGTPVDRSGFELNQGNGYLVHPEVVPGQAYTFTYPQGVGRLVRVFPVGGDQIDKVNGEVVIGGKDFPAGNGTIHLTVEGVGRNGKIRLGVQLQ